MTQTIARRPSRAWQQLHPPRLPWRRLGMVVLVAVTALTASTVASTFAHLRTPAPTGAHAVGKGAAVLEDTSRPEPATAAAGDNRRVRIVAWYPAIAGTGTAAAYLDDLDRIGEGLEASGSIGGLERAGMGLVTTGALSQADVATAADLFPVVILSPGNATNVEFYSALAEDLASHGYVVIGLDHPFQSAAVDIGGTVATYSGDPPLSEAHAVTSARIEERVADIGFVVDRLEADAAGFGTLAGRLDLGRVAAIGHSNGGLAAVEICDDPRISACANLDGQNLAGPFGIGADPAAPAIRSCSTTKDVELHSALCLSLRGGRDCSDRGCSGGVMILSPTPDVVLWRPLPRRARRRRDDRHPRVRGCLPGPCPA